MKNKKFVSKILSLFMYALYLGIGIYIGCTTHAKFGFLYFVGILIYTMCLALRENIQWKEVQERYIK